MISALIDNPILLLFTVASIGYLLGSIKLGGNSLGVAAILFTGLLFGAIDDQLKVPDIVFLLGLVLFVYSIGLSSGPAFFKSYKKNGFRDFSFIMAMLLLSGLIAVAVFAFFGLSAATIAGVYSGSTTNTPALAGVIDYINTNASAGGELDSSQAVIGYSLSYPMGVMGSMLAIIMMEKIMKIDYKAEQKALRKEYPSDSYLSSDSLKVTNPQMHGMTWRDLLQRYGWDIVIGRIIKNEKTTLANYDTIIELGDELMIVGAEDDLHKAISDLGESVKSNKTYDRQEYDVRRIFVSNSRVVGRTIGSLNLAKKFNAVISRIRRGDIDMLAKDNTVLESGDRIRFIARRKDLRSLSKFFGDSYTASSRVNIFSFGLGIGIGLVIGMINIPLGSFSFKLGYAGGPLIVGLFLGALRRTGPIVWTLPYSANVTLQQLGLILLLAGIGVNSGSSFANSFNEGAVLIIIASIIISILTAICILLIGYKLVKLPFSILMGMVSNQPAILDFALNKSGNRIPQYGYTMMFPIASVMKIIIAQVMFIILSS